MLRVRDLALTPPLLLAPMEGVTDLGFRRLIRSIGGCGLTVTEFIPGLALAEGHLPVARVLHEHDCDVHRDVPDQGPPLHGQVEAGRAAAVEFLLNCGVDANARNPRGSTGLHLAARAC